MIQDHLGEFHRCWVLKIAWKTKNSTLPLLSTFSWQTFSLIILARETEKCFIQRERTRFFLQRSTNINSLIQVELNGKTRTEINYFDITISINCQFEFLLVNLKILKMWYNNMNYACSGFFERKIKDNLVETKFK